MKDLASILKIYFENEDEIAVISPDSKLIKLRKEEFLMDLSFNLEIPQMRTKVS